MTEKETTRREAIDTILNHIATAGTSAAAGIVTVAALDTEQAEKSDLVDELAQRETIKIYEKYILPSDVKHVFSTYRSNQKLFRSMPMGELRKCEANPNYNSPPSVPDSPPHLFSVPAGMAPETSVARLEKEATPGSSKGRG